MPNKEKTEPEEELLELVSRMETLAESDDPDAETNEKCSQYPQTESGMAMRIKERYADELRFWNGDWYWYDGICWSKRPDMPIRLVKKTAEQVLLELRYMQTADESDEAQKARLSRAKYARSFESYKTATAAVGFCRSYMAYTAAVFEIHSPLLINFRNGTYDLDTATLRPHCSADNFLSVLPFSFDPSAQCPRWLGFLSTVLSRDDEVINFMRLFVGCTLLGGSTDDELMMWVTGSGRNGKSTFLETIAYAMGQMSTQIPNNLILAKKYDSHPTEIAKLHNVRFAMCTDVDINSKIDDGQFKRLCSTGLVTGRFMNKDFFDFPITWKLWMSVNSLPATNDFSDAMWRRVIVVPFSHTFSDEEVDKSIKSDLRSESEIQGIWNWMIGAALEVRKSGFPLASTWPERVTSAISEWKGDEDWFSLFVAQRCEYDHSKSVTLKDLYLVYKTWADLNEISAYSRKSFSHRVQMDNRIRKNDKNHALGTQFMGIGLIRQYAED